MRIAIPVSHLSHQAFVRNMKDSIEYLRSWGGFFKDRCWFQRTFGKQEPFDHIREAVAGLVQGADSHAIHALVDRLYSQRPNDPVE